MDNLNSSPLYYNKLKILNGLKMKNKLRITNKTKPGTLEKLLKF